MTGSYIILALPPTSLSGTHSYSEVSALFRLRIDFIHSRRSALHADVDVADCTGRATCIDTWDNVPGYRENPSWVKQLPATVPRCRIQHLRSLVIKGSAVDLLVIKGTKVAGIAIYLLL